MKMGIEEPAVVHAEDLGVATLSLQCTASVLMM